MDSTLILDFWATFPVLLSHIIRMWTEFNLIPQEEEEFLTSMLRTRSFRTCQISPFSCQPTFWMILNVIGRVKIKPKYKNYSRYLKSEIIFTELYCSQKYCKGVKTLPVHQRGQVHSRSFISFYKGTFLNTINYIESDSINLNDPDNYSCYNNIELFSFFNCLPLTIPTRSSAGG